MSLNCARRRPVWTFSGCFFSMNSATLLYKNSIFLISVVVVVDLCPPPLFCKKTVLKRCLLSYPPTSSGYPSLDPVCVPREAH